jgi:hypothetical protein
MPPMSRVLAGTQPLLMVTDPPYGIDYDPTWRLRAGVNRNTQKLGAVTNDDRADWTDAWQLFPGDVAYVWHAGLKAGLVQTSLEQAGIVVRAQIVWRRIGWDGSSRERVRSRLRLGRPHGQRR